MRNNFFPNILYRNLELFFVPYTNKCISTFLDNLSGYRKKCMRFAVLKNRPQKGACLIRLKRRFVHPPVRMVALKNKTFSPFSYLFPVIFLSLPNPRQHWIILIAPKPQRTEKIEPCVPTRPAK